MRHRKTVLQFADRHPSRPGAGQGAINLQPYQIARQRVFFASKAEFNKSILRELEFGSVSSVAANNLPADRAGRTTAACRQTVVMRFADKRAVE